MTELRRRMDEEWWRVGSLSEHANHTIQRLLGLLQLTRHTEIGPDSPLDLLARF